MKSLHHVKDMQIQDNTVEWAAEKLNCKKVELYSYKVTADIITSKIYSWCKITEDNNKNINVCNYQQNIYGVPSCSQLIKNVILYTY